MDTEEQKTHVLIQTRAAELPPEIVALVTDGALEVAMFRLQEKFDLTEKQVTSLENELVLILLFFLPDDGLAERITQSLEVSPQMAEAITRDCYDTILWQIEDVLEQLRQDRVESKELENISPAVALEKLATEIEINHIDRPAEPVTEPIPTPPPTPTGQVHGYGAYRETVRYGDEEEKSATPASEAEPLVKAVDQTDLLQKKNEEERPPTYPAT